MDEYGLFSLRDYIRKKKKKEETNEKRWGYYVPFVSLVRRKTCNIAAVLSVLSGLPRLHRAFHHTPSPIQTTVLYVRKASSNLTHIRMYLPPPMSRVSKGTYRHLQRFFFLSPIQKLREREKKGGGNEILIRKCC